MKNIKFKFRELKRTEQWDLLLHLNSYTQVCGSCLQLTLFEYTKLKKKTNNHRIPTEAIHCNYLIDFTGLQILIVASIPQYKYTVAVIFPR